MPRLLATAAGAGLLLAVGLSTPAWAATCDPYTGACEGSGTVITPGENPGGTVTGGGPTGVTEQAGTVRTAAKGATLPFTGAEVLLAGMVGLGAVGGGAVLVVAGRRRAPRLS